MSYLKALLTSPWQSVTLLRAEKDRKRVQVLDHMILKLKEVLQLIAERNFHRTLDKMNSLVLASKLLMDPKPTIHFY